MIIRYRNTLQDYMDRRKKLRPRDDGQNDVVELAKGFIVVTAAVFALWLFLGAA
jgi:lipid-binding SYLF domain-containing protein